MARYHKIVTDQEIRYREFNKGTGFYEEGTLSEEELVEQLLAGAVEEVIEVDKAHIERAISTIPDRHHRELIQSYLDYVDCVVESQV
ncbi:hypothetical protein [Oceanobacillus massiliensis]|uniref:hypothetical protein n=1 Tax=Oceanobacillus massiliensis TaxID=1465765 RepID=UPI0030187CD9